MDEKAIVDDAVEKLSLFIATKLNMEGSCSLSDAMDELYFILTREKREISHAQRKIEEHFGWKWPCEDE